MRPTSLVLVSILLLTLRPSLPAVADSYDGDDVELTLRDTPPESQQVEAGDGFIFSVRVFHNRDDNFEDNHNATVDLILEVDAGLQITRVENFRSPCTITDAGRRASCPLELSEDLGVWTEVQVQIAEEAPGGTYEVTATAGSLSDGFSVQVGSGGGTGPEVTFNLYNEPTEPQMPGTDFYFGVFARNEGPGQATDVQVGAAVPEGFELLSASSSGTCTLADSKRTMTCTLVLEEGQGAGTLFRARVLEGTAPGTYPIEWMGNGQGETFMLTIEGGGGGEQTADLAVSKTADRQTVAPGEVVTYTVTVSNAGPDPATGILVQENFPAGFALASSSVSQGALNVMTGRWSVGSLASGSQATLEVTGSYAEAGSFTNEAEVVGADQEDPDSTPADGQGDDYAAVEVTVEAGASADLSLDCEVEEGNKKNDGELPVGEEATLICNLKNEGEAEAEMPVFIITFEGGEVVSISLSTEAPTWILIDPLTMTTETFEAGAEVELVWNFMPTEEGSLTITAETDAENAQPKMWAAGFAVIESSDPVPDLTVSTQQEGFPIYGDPYNVTVRVENLRDEESLASNTLIELAIVDLARPAAEDQAADLFIVDYPDNCSETTSEVLPSTYFLLTCENGSIGEPLGLPLSIIVTKNFDFQGQAVPALSVKADIHPLSPRLDRDQSNHQVEVTKPVLNRVGVRFVPEERTVVEGMIFFYDVEIVNNTPEEQSILMDLRTPASGSISLEGVLLGDGFGLGDIPIPPDDGGGFQPAFSLEGFETVFLNLVVKAEVEGKGELCFNLIEPNEQTSCVTITVEPPRLLPDLTVTAVPITDGGGRDDPYVSSGEEYTVEVSLSNIGEADSEDSALRIELTEAFFLDPPPSGCSFAGDFLSDSLNCPSVGLLQAGGAPRVLSARLRAEEDSLSSFHPHYFTLKPLDPPADRDEVNNLTELKTFVTKAAVEVDVYVPDEVEPHGDVLLSLVDIRNFTDAEATEFSLQFVLPEGFEFKAVEGDSEAAMEGSTITVMIPYLSINERATMGLSGSFPEAGTHETRITVEQEGKVLTDEAYITEVTETPSLKVTKTASDLKPRLNNAVFGNNFLYTITAVSTEDRVVQVFDEFPESIAHDHSVGFNFSRECSRISPTGAMTNEPSGIHCTNVSLQAGVPWTVEFPVIPLEGGRAINRVFVDRVSASEAVEVQALVLSLDTNDNPLLEYEVSVGAEANYLATVINMGTELAPDVELRFNWMETERYRSASLLEQDGTLNESVCFLQQEVEARCDLGTLQPQQAEQVRFTNVVTATGKATGSFRVTSGDGRRDDEQVARIGTPASTRTSVGYTATGGAGGKRADAVDVYLGGMHLADDLEPGTATAFQPVTLSRVAPRVDITDATSPDNSNPLASFTIDLFGTPEDTLAFSEQTLLLLTETPGDTLGYVLKKAARTEAADPAKADVFFLHASADAPALDVRLTGVEADLPTLAFGETSDYLSLDPASYRVGIFDAATGEELNGFRFDMTGSAGQAVALALTGRLADGTFSLEAFDGTGSDVTTPVQEADALPTRFSLQGNYPNPFNPTTTLRFDLPESAQVRVEVFDVLGRRVLALPAESMAAGADRTLVLDARSLASGLYVYRLTAEGAQQTHRATGRFVLLK